MAGLSQSSGLSGAAGLSAGAGLSQGAGLTAPDGIIINNPAFTAAANSFLTRAANSLGAEPSSTYQGAVDQMIRDMQADGSWDECVFVLNLSAPSQAVALMDWKQDRSATLSGTTTFTANSGILLGSNPAFINTGILLPAQNDAHVSVRIGTYVYASQRTLIFTQTSTTTSLRTPATTNTGNPSSRMNSTSELGGTSGLFTDLTGQTFLNRTNSADYALINGANSETITRISAAPAGTISFGGSSTANAYLGSRFHGGTVGNSLTAGQMATIAAAFATFRTTMSSTN